MKKRALLFTVISSIVLSLVGGAAWAAPEGISVKIDGKNVAFKDSKPFIQAESNRTMVPIRFIAENLGCKVDWTPKLKLVSIMKDNKNVKLFIGESQALVNGEMKAFDAPPIIKENRTFVPLRFISETLSAKVEWVPAAKTIAITTADVLPEVTQSITDLPEATSEPIQTKLPEATPTPTKLLEATTTITKLPEVTPTPIVTRLPEIMPTVTKLPEVIPEITPLPQVTPVSTTGAVTPVPTPTIQIAPLSALNDIVRDHNTEDILFVEIDGVEKEYQGDAFAVAKCLIPAIRPEDRTFDFSKALEIINASSDLAVVETMNQTVTQNNEDVGIAVDKIASLLKNSIGLVLTEKLRNSLSTDLATAFAGGTIYDRGGDTDHALGLTWSSETWEKGKTYHYKIVYGIKDKNSGRILYAIPYQLELATSKYSKTSWFGLKEESGFSCSIHVEAMKIAKLLNH